MQNLSIENQAIRAVNRDQNYWREVITAWEKSGEYQKDFCTRMNIKIGTFAHWRGVFSKENKKLENKFIELRVTKKPPEKLDQFVIECPSGHKIIYSSSLQTEQGEIIFKMLGLIA